MATLQWWANEFRHEVPNPKKAKAKSTGSFTERLVDVLAEHESMSTRQLIRALGSRRSEVIEELRELQALGIVIRTGRTISTRWWLG